MTETKINTFKNWLQEPVSSVPLAFFRIAFGIMMFFSACRFIIFGWVEELYVKPEYFFTFYGFEWVKILPPYAMHAAFVLLAVLSLCIAFGFYYRISIILYFFLFTYIELIDKALYLNHYYFISMLSFMLIFLPAHTNYSLDVLHKRTIGLSQIPRWTLLAVQLQIASVYFFGGVAKIKYDWLIEAQPLKIWLSARAGLPIIGPWIEMPITAYLFSWIGLIFDLFVPFFLFWRRTTVYAYVFVVIFHFLTWVLFYIGMFPWIMMVSTWIFFSPTFLGKILHFMKLSKISAESIENQAIKPFSLIPQYILGIFLSIQCLLPFRHLMYANHICWSEEAFRFSWHIMLIEKNGWIEFIVVNPADKKSWIVKPEEHLTPLQAKMMRSQPDMILQFAQYLQQHYQKLGIQNVEIYADSYVSLNGRPAKKFVKENVNLTQIHDGFGTRNWITQF